MATITDIKRKIDELAPAQFQEFCDTMLSKLGYGIVNGLGMKPGTSNTTIGNPDTYFRSKDGKYVLVCYTIQKKGLAHKLRDDIEKCLDPVKTRLDASDISEIICCHTSSTLSAGDDKNLHDLCESHGVSLTILGIDELASRVYRQYRSLAKDCLDLSIDTNQILSADDFISQYNANGMSAPLNTSFQYRKKEKAEINDVLSSNPIVIISGAAGVGKTRLALEVAQGIAESDGYELLCVKNKNLGIYDDLVSITEQKGKYLFLIDDANELANVGQILEYITKGGQGYDVKIIATVRDYAISEVLHSVNKYVQSPKIIKIRSFTDDEMREFLDVNVGINNDRYVKQITSISKGNPRMAYMAGRLALENHSLAAIRDASQLYNAYYKEYVDKTFGRDKKLCVAAGILSVVGAIMLDDTAGLQGLLDCCEMTAGELEDEIQYLSQQEVVEVRFDLVAMLSDQCLANYMLYYVFLKKRLVSLSDVLEIGYMHFREGAIKLINVALNLFDTDEILEYCKMEVIKVWNNLNKSESPYYSNFARDFHVFNPEEAFILAHREICDIPAEGFDVHSIDFCKNSYCSYESILQYLEGYRYSDCLEYAVEILLEYCSKNAKTMNSGCEWLKNAYGIDPSSRSNKYYCQMKVTTYIHKAILDGNTAAQMVGFQWATYLLEFSFSYAEMERGDRIAFYDIDLKQLDGIEGCRDICWKILQNISLKSDWKSGIISFLNTYARNVMSVGLRNQAIVLREVDCVEQLLSAVRCDQVIYLKVIRTLVHGWGKLGIKCNRDLTGLLSGSKWCLYELLEYEPHTSDLPYDEYNDGRNRRLREYGKSVQQSNIPVLVQTMNDIAGEVDKTRQDVCMINQGFELIIQQFDCDCMWKLMCELIEHGENIKIRPCVVLKPLCLNRNVRWLLSYIEQTKSIKKYEWLCEFFASLPPKKATSYMEQRMLSVLNNEIGERPNSAVYIEPRLLDKFLKVEPNIYPIVSTIIFNKFKDDPSMLEICFNFLFNENIYHPDKLINLFSCNMDLLEEIYFRLLETGKRSSTIGNFLGEFLRLGESWLKKYSDVFWVWAAESLTRDNIRYENSKMWMSDDYEKYFDYIYSHRPKDMREWRTAQSFKAVMTQIEPSGTICRHQQAWIEHTVAKYASSDDIYTIFMFVCDLNDDLRTSAIKTFLKNNEDPGAFCKLQLIPSSWFGVGGLTELYRKQIKFLKSLAPLVSGVKYLEHKSRIKFLINYLEGMIIREEAEKIRDSLYL